MDPQASSACTSLHVIFMKIFSFSDCMFYASWFSVLLYHSCLLIFLPYPSFNSYILNYDVYISIHLITTILNKGCPATCAYNVYFHCIWSYTSLINYLFTSSNSILFHDHTFERWHSRSSTIYKQTFSSSKPTLPCSLLHLYSPSTFKQAS